MRPLVRFAVAIAVLLAAAVAVGVVVSTHSADVSPSAPVLSIHRRQECAVESLWSMDFGSVETFDALSTGDHGAKWEPIESTTCDVSSSCFKKENVAISHKRLTLSAPSASSARLHTRLELQDAAIVSTDGLTSRLRILTKFPAKRDAVDASITLTVLPINVTLTVGVAAATSSSSESRVYLVSSTHNMSVRAVPPCPEEIGTRFHAVEFAWSASGWLRAFWDGHVLYELPIARDDVTPSANSAASLDVEFALRRIPTANTTTSSATFQIKHVAVERDANTPCRPRQSPETNCRHHKAFVPRLGNDQGYLSLAEINEYVTTTAPSLFPPGFTRVETIGQSIENRSILALCVGRCHATSVPQVLFTGMHHSREPISMMNLVYTIDLLAHDLTNGIVDTLAVLFTRQLWFVLVVNPDGYARNEATAMWQSGASGQRKNARPTGCTRAEDAGVDLNRNYDVCFAVDSVGSSTDPCAEDYRGPEPFSEPETRAIKAFVERDDVHVTASLNYHSFGRYFNIPFACKTQGVPAPDDLAIYEQWAREMARFNAFRYGQPWKDDNLYSVNGETSDWLWQQHGIFAMSPEVGPAFSTVTDRGFWPKREDVAALSTELYYSNLVTAQFAGPMYAWNVTRVTYQSDNQSLAVEWTLENRGLATAGDVEVVVMTSAGWTMSRKPPRESRVTTTLSSVGTIRNATREVRSVTVSSAALEDGVLHVLVRDAASCRYVRVSLRNTTTSDVAVEQWEPWTLPLCGVCATLGRGKTKLEKDDPQCQVVQDLVTLERLARNVDGGATTKKEATSVDGASASTTTTSSPPIPPATTEALTRTPEPTPTPTTSEPTPTTPEPTPAPTSAPTPEPTPSPTTPTPAPTPAPVPSTVAPTPTPTAVDETTVDDAEVNASSPPSSSIQSFAIVPALGLLVIVGVIVAFLVQRRRRRLGDQSHRRSGHFGRKDYKVVNHDAEDDDDDDDDEDGIVGSGGWGSGGRRHVEHGFADNDDDDEDEAEFGRRRSPTSRTKRAFSDEEGI